MVVTAVQSFVCITFCKFKREIAALKKQPKPPAAAEKSEKPTLRRTKARCSPMNGNNSGRKFKHSAKLKDGSEDDWFAAWDVKNNVFVASARTAANVVSIFPARFRLGALQVAQQADEEIATHDSQQRLGQGQGLHIAKRKFFAVLDRKFAQEVAPMEELYMHKIDRH